MRITALFWKPLNRADKEACGAFSQMFVTSWDSTRTYHLWFMLAKYLQQIAPWRLRVAHWWSLCGSISSICNFKTCGQVSRDCRYDTFKNLLFGAYVPTVTVIHPTWSGHSEHVDTLVRLLMTKTFDSSKDLVDYQFLNNRIRSYHEEDKKSSSLYKIITERKRVDWDYWSDWPYGSGFQHLIQQL